MNKHLKLIIRRAVGEEFFENLCLVKEDWARTLNRAARNLSRESASTKSARVALTKFAVPERQTFFGYYDLTPFSENNRFLLAMVGPKDNIPPTGNETLSIGYFNLYEGKDFNEVGDTSSWCWQQGCRLQWFPDNENELIIYNKIIQGSYGAVVQNIRNRKEVVRYAQPVYDLDKSGQWALSLNFSRLNRLRPGYGYVNFADHSKDQAFPANDGIFLLNLKSGRTELLISLEQLAKLKPLPSMQQAQHYVNHLSFSPCGKKFMFFHLWKASERRFNRLITSDLFGNNFCILEDQASVSHYTWKSASQLLVTTTNQGNQHQYRLYQDKPGIYEVIGKNLLTRDGHPSYSPVDGSLLTDTYPDKYGDQHLLLYTPEAQLEELCRLMTPTRYRFKFQGEARCDLHPRWDRNGELICVDSSHEGQRALYVIKRTNAD